MSRSILLVLLATGCLWAEPVPPEPANLEQGKGIFLRNCSPCHREDGSGNIGPSLLPNGPWHGGRNAGGIEAYFRTSSARGCPNWKEVLNPQEFRDVAGYVLSLKAPTP